MAKREEIGRVVSDKMQKTVVVELTRKRPHPLYHKLVKRRRRFKAHNEDGAALGDLVKIEEVRPLSKDKTWRVMEIIRKGSLK